MRDALTHVAAVCPLGLAKQLLPDYARRRRIRWIAWCVEGIMHAYDPDDANAAISE